LEELTCSSELNNLRERERKEGEREEREQGPIFSDIE
jgi:hypothetical protein